MFFYRFYDCPKVNFGPLSTFAPEKGKEEHKFFFFYVKNGFSIKNLFWAILEPKMIASLNSG